MDPKTKHKHLVKERKIPLKEKQPLPLNNGKVYIFLALIVLISFIAYLPVFHNTLLNWDDEDYIRDLIVSSFNLGDIFSKFVMGNYHPVTMLVYAVEYRLWGLNPSGYHSVNLLLHLLNIILVFYTISCLSDRKEVALIAALLFGIHPLHVESVAWAAELKDLLYTFFFLSSYIYYMKYREKGYRKLYILSLLFFVLSLLSKAMAASLPLVLLLTDYFKGRKIDRKALPGMIPYFTMAFILGIIAIYAQRSSDSILNATVISFPDRVVFACFGFITYLVKMAFPFNLSVFYSYPVNNGVIHVPVICYLYLIIFLTGSLFVFYKGAFNKKAIFGMGFFAITIFLVLQLLPVGKAMMADRYVYIPSIGLFFLCGEGAWYLWTRKLKSLVISLLFIVIIVFPVNTYARCKVWYNDLTFLNDVIEHTQTMVEAYYNRGIIHMNEGRTDDAISDFNKVIELKPDYSNAYNNKGLLLMNLKKEEESMQFYNQAIKLDPKNADAYYNRATLYNYQKKNKEAIADFDRAIEFYPAYGQAYNNRGSIYYNEGKGEEALRDFRKAVELNPGNAQAYYNMGILSMSERRTDEALNQFSKAISIKPDYTNALNNRAIVYFEEKKFPEALADLSRVIELEPDNFNAYKNRGMIYLNLKRNDEASGDFKRAIQLNSRSAEAYLNLANLLFEERKFGESIPLYTQVLSLWNNFPEALFKRGLAEYYCQQNSPAFNDLKKSASLGYKPASEALSGLMH